MFILRAVITKSPGGIETGGGGRGTGHNIQKNNITIGHDKNWLEPTRSKMAKDLQLQCMLIVIVVA